MGNNPSSSSKPATPNPSTPVSGSVPGSAHESPRHHRKDARNIIPGHIQRSAAPPEPSMAQAQGSTVVNRPKSLPPTAVSSLSGSPLSNASAPIRSSEAKIVDAKPAESRPTPRDQPSKPVDVPVESSSLRSHHSAHVEPHIIPNSSITDMYLTRPPRLPLPIDEEVHTPGSPILAPEQDQTLPEVEPVDSPEVITRKSSALSATTVDEEDNDELRVDKTRPTVPTKLEWLRGGEKVYVTGTIFQWNRKQRLHPM